MITLNSSHINADFFSTPCLELLKYQKIVRSYIEFVSVSSSHTIRHRNGSPFIVKSGKENMYIALLFSYGLYKILLWRNILGVQSQ